MRDNFVANLEMLSVGNFVGEVGGEVGGEIRGEVIGGFCGGFFGERKSTSPVKENPPVGGF